MSQTTTPAPSTDSTVVGYMLINSITGASPFVIDDGNHTATFKGMTAPPPTATTPVGLNIVNPGNQISFLSFGLSGATHQFEIAQNGTPRITFDDTTQLSLQPGGGTVIIGASGQTGNLNVNGVATINGDANSSSLIVQKSLTISGASGASANQLTVATTISVSGASAATLDAGTGTIKVGAANAATLNSGTGTITVSNASAATLDAGTGTIKVEAANAATLNSGTGTITVSNAAAATLDAGTGTIKVEAANAATLNSGTGTITVSNAAAATLDAGTGTIKVEAANAATLNSGTGTITVSNAAAATLDAGTGTIKVSAANAATLNSGTGTITVSNAAAATLDAGTGTIKVSAANAAILNSGTGTITVSNAAAATLDAGTGTIKVSAANAAILNSGTGTITVSNAAAATLDAGTGTIKVGAANAATLNSGTGTITVSNASAATLDAGTGAISVSGASAATLNAKSLTVQGTANINGSMSVNPATAGGTASINLGPSAQIQANNSGELSFVQGGTATTLKDFLKLDPSGKLSLPDSNTQIILGGTTTPPTNTQLLVHGNIQLGTDVLISPTAAGAIKGVEISGGFLAAKEGIYSAKAATLDGGIQFKNTLSSENGNIRLGAPFTPPNQTQLHVFGNMQLGTQVTISPTATPQATQGIEIKGGFLAAHEGIYSAKAATLDGGVQFKNTLSTVDGNIRLGAPFTPPDQTQLYVFGNMQIGATATISPTGSGLSINGGLNVDGSILVNGVEVISSSGKGSSGVKTFIIQHPNQSNKFLVHATLEGPENAVFYRGTAELTDGETEITLPPYFESLTKAEGRTIVLSNVDGFDQLAIKTTQGKQIYQGRFTVFAENPNSKQRFNWEVKAVRNDVDQLQTEPDKTDLTVANFGPYTFGVKKEKTLN